MSRRRTERAGAPGRLEIDENGDPEDIEKERAEQMPEREKNTENSALTSAELDMLLEEVEPKFPTLPDLDIPEKSPESELGEIRRTFSREQIASLGNIELEVRIELGQTTMPFSEVSALRPGSVVILDKHVNELVNILVNGKAIARGELLIVNGCFCVRVKEFL